MQPQYKYILQQYAGAGTRYTCPSCHDNEKTFVRYINVENGKYIGAHVGRCNREEKCGYHYTPSDFFKENGFLLLSPFCSKFRIPKQKPKPSFLPVDTFKALLGNYEKNNLFTWMCSRLGSNEVSKGFHTYKIGTSNLWGPSTVFFQIDTKGKIRTGKVMLYNFNTGKRVKEPYSHISWVHKGIEKFELSTCFFGEHLIDLDKSKAIGIVESEKTALIASIYYPYYTWIATGGLGNLTKEKCKVLRGRDIVLFPDAGCFNRWEQKAHELRHVANFMLNDEIENNTTPEEKSQGFDLADILLKSEPHEYRQ